MSLARSPFWLVLDVSRMKPRTILLLWLVIFMAFAGYGFLGPGLSYQNSSARFEWEAALESTITFSAIGFCFGAYLSTGLVVLKLVRRERLFRFWAVLLLAFLALLSIPGPMGMVLLAEQATNSGMRLYQKELFYFPTVALDVMLWVVGGTFLVLAVCVSSVTGCPLRPRKEQTDGPK